jgi:hypothetical protein
VANDANKDERKWASVFIEVALRAVRRVHYEYGLWGIGPQWEMNRQRARRINAGQGIELAFETAVCDAITQECIRSPSMAGVWVDDGPDGEPDKEMRYFTVEREQSYLTGDNQKVDLFLRKYSLKDGKPGEELKPVKLPSFIEAKRARRWTADIKSGKAKYQARQLKNVQNDLQKLKAEITHRSALADDKHILGHVLVWGVYGKGKHQDHPVTFFNEVGNGVELHALRWLPLQWDQPSRDQLKNAELGIPKVQAALWIGLAEVRVQ